ncbi:hypothetical protein [Bradyrhizobium sp. USDA 4508]
MSDPGTGISGTSQTVARGRPPPADPKFYIQWGQENTKAFVQNANAALGQLLTVSTTLLGGTIAFWNYFPIDPKYRFVALSAALFTVLLCLFSAMPRKTSFDLTSATDIRRHMEDVFDYKSRRLTIAKWSLVLTICIMIGGLVLTALEDKAIPPVTSTTSPATSGGNGKSP